MKPFIALLLASGSLTAITIQIDYSFDDNNFFESQESRDAIESVAKFYGDLLQDNLLRIDSSEFANSSWTANISNPATGNTTAMDNLVVPEDTIIVFVGSRLLPGNTLGTAGPGGFGASGITSWFERLFGRGQAGATFFPSAADLRTDVAPWGGSISFDQDTSWNFSLEKNQSGFEFVQVALHEMGHVLGLGPSSAWDNLVSNGVFTGPASIASHGSAPPADNSHFLASINSPRYGSFGTTHGTQRPSVMLASSTDTGSNFDVVTDLDLAALIDLGWEVTVPAPLSSSALSPAAANFSWPSSSFCSYEVLRSSDLQTFNDGSPVFTGNGTTQFWQDPSPAQSGAFYLFEVTSNIVAPIIPEIVLETSLAVETAKLQQEIITTIEVAPRMVIGCTCHGHGDENRDHATEQ